MSFFGGTTSIASEAFRGDGVTAGGIFGPTTTTKTSVLLSELVAAALVSGVEQDVGISTGVAVTSSSSSWTISEGIGTESSTKLLKSVGDRAGATVASDTVGRGAQRALEWKTYFNLTDWQASQLGGLSRQGIECLLRHWVQENRDPIQGEWREI